MQGASIIILAGGKGSRLGGEIPKPLVEINGRPLVEPVIRQALSGEWDTIIVIISPYTAAVRRKYGDKRLTFLELEPLGTGYCVQKALPLITSGITVIAQADDSFFYLPDTLESIAAFARSSDAPFIVATELIDDPMPYAYVETDAEGRLLKVCKQPEDLLAPPPKAIVTGLYAGQTEWIAEQLPRVPVNAKGELGLPGIIDIGIREQANLYTYPLPPDSWHGVNTPDELQRARMSAQRG